MHECFIRESTTFGSNQTLTPRGAFLTHKNIKVRDRREFIKLSIMSPVFYSILVQLTAVSVDGIEHSGIMVNLICNSRIP